MEQLFTLFPKDNFTLLAVIVCLPLLGAVVNGVFGKRLGREAVTLMALSVIGISFLLSVVTFLALSHEAAAHGGEHTRAARLYWHGWEWIRVSLFQGGSSALNIDFSVDALSATMALVVTGVGFLIHLYSSKYMEEDPGYYRFFAYLNLFIFSMLVLILGDSLPVLFVGWEGVGLCSYLLIGFWFHESKNAAAGMKAFVVNRIGDFGLICAMGLILYYTRALDWTGINAGARSLLTPIQVWPIGHHFPFYETLGKLGETLNQPVYVSAATLVGLFLFLGCAGKSAQIPLYVWLPDAMAGPTPVSALIHAATMVTAGVYLVCRLSGVFVLSPFAMFIVALIGALTALFAATIAFAQNDIKKVLAYSTVSQLGYMFLGVGVGAFAAGFFHVLTHAFFKACLFLGAGSVIHAMHARIHDTDASQDMRNMGGLRRYLPYTFATFLVSWAAIVGFPLTSGFFSKDEILLKAYSSSIAAPVPGGTVGSGANALELFQWPEWGGKVLYAIGWITAVLTAFYMTRLLIGTFYGEFRGWKIVKGYQSHGHDHHDDHHGHGHEPLEGPTPHESPWQMWVPLIVLGFLAGVAGFLNAHPLGIHPLDHWLEPVFAGATEHVKLVEGAEGLMGPFIGLAVLAFAAGVGGAYWVYITQKGEPARRLVEANPGLYRLVVDKWRVDELYDEAVVGSADALAELSKTGDKWVVDGILARLTAFLAKGSGALLRYAQNGRVQAYASFMVVGLGLVSWLLLAPRAEARTLEDSVAGEYKVKAAPGLGYKYRWDADGDGVWDSKEFAEASEVQLKLDRGATRPVRLEVRNAFGQTDWTEVVLSRPQADLSNLTAPDLDQLKLPSGATIRKAPSAGAGEAQ